MIYRLDILQNNMIQHTQFWYSLHLQAAEAQKKTCTSVQPYQSLHNKYGS